MRASRVVLVAVAVICVAAGSAWTARPARAQLGAVRVDRDGWWSRANKGDLPLTSPSLAFPVPDKAIAASASNGEPEKVGALGVVLDVDPASFERLILNMAEATDPGANVGVVANPAGGTAGGAIDACLITGDWVSTKNGSWPARPAYDATACVPGSRSADGVWSFDLTTFARRWLAGGAPQNGVALVEHVDAPVTFQVAWGDRTTSAITFSLDVTTADDNATFAPIDTSDDSSTATTVDAGSSSSDFGSVTSAPATSTYEFNASDSFTTPVPRATPPTTAAARTTPARTTTGGRARPIAATPTKGQLPPALLLLIPLGLLVALATSLSLGPAGDPAGAGLVRREGGVSRALALRRPPEDRP